MNGTISVLLVTLSRARVVLPLPIQDCLPRQD